MAWEEGTEAGENEKIGLRINNGFPDSPSELHVYRSGRSGPREPRPRGRSWPWLDIF